MRDLTAEEKAEYLTSPNKCPVCRHTDIEGGCVDIDGREAHQRCRCNDCDAVWHDVYVLARVETDPDD
jgi:transposase-like protein